MRHGGNIDPAPARGRAARALLAFAAVVAWTGVAALPSDRQQPIEIRAAHAEIDDQRGVAVYSGDVVMDQGTLRVTAERLTIHTERNDVVRVVAEGDRAHYEQRPEPDADLVEADARRIVYHTREQRVELEGDARLSQASDEFSGEVIHYDLRSHRVRARSADGAPVRMVIQPGRLGTPLRGNGGEAESEAAPDASAPEGEENAAEDAPSAPARPDAARPDADG